MRSFHSASGFHRQSFARRPFLSQQRLNAFGLGRNQLFTQPGYFYDGSYWWPDWWAGDSQIAVSPPAPEAPPQPQVIVIRTDGQGRMDAEPAPDYSYAGCQAIPNGFHCDIGGGAHYVR